MNKYGLGLIESRSNSLGLQRCQVYTAALEKSAMKFPNFTEVEKGDRDFYKELTGNERLKI